jgi:hypothetical protein
MPHRKGEPRYNQRILVGVAQLAEHRTVAPTVAGSIPVSHPIKQFRAVITNWCSADPRTIFKSGRFTLGTQRRAARNAGISIVTRRNNRQFIGPRIYRQLGNSFAELVKEWPV